MKHLLIAIITLSAFAAQAQVNVNGYYKRNGTYVQPHTRTAPDGNPYNNRSYQPRQYSPYNPYQR